MCLCCGSDKEFYSVRIYQIMLINLISLYTTRSVPSDVGAVHCTMELQPGNKSGHFHTSQEVGTPSPHRRPPLIGSHQQNLTTSWYYSVSVKHGVVDAIVAQSNTIVSLMPWYSAPEFLKSISLIKNNTFINIIFLITQE